MVAFNGDLDSERTKGTIAFVEEILNRKGVYQTSEERKENLLWMIDWVRVRIEEIDVENPSDWAAHVLSALVSTTGAMKLYAKHHKLGQRIVNLVAEQEVLAERKAGDWLAEFATDHQ